MLLQVTLYGWEKWLENVSCQTSKIHSETHNQNLFVWESCFECQFFFKLCLHFQHFKRNGCVSVSVFLSTEPFHNLAYKRMIKRPIMDGNPTY